MADMTATYCQTSEADQSASPHDSCDQSPSGRPLPPSCLHSLTSLLFFTPFLLFLRLVQHSGERRQSAERQEKGDDSGGRAWEIQSPAHPLSCLQA